ncbi:MAG TPA: S41 family peptidase [Gemmatimonadota bacterium]|nr:S41 family peptidase [Gemmatimonadota bacterium]
MSERRGRRGLRVYRTAVAVGVGLVGLAVGGALMERAAAAQEADSFDRAQLRRVTQIIEQRYVEPIAADDLYRMAIDGMLGELDDPNTRLIEAGSSTDLDVTLTGNYAGLGIRVGQVGDWVTVMSVISGTPAEREGLLPGDRIVGVDGESVAGWDEVQVIERLRGPVGEPVTVRVARLGLSEPIDLSVTRDSIHVPPVLAYEIDEDVGVVQLTQFSHAARGELRSAIEELQRQGADRLVLDLRGNPGGLLEEGVAVADLFLPRGETIVSTASRVEDQNYVFKAEEAAVFGDLPIVVLIDGASASASEIVAGALQDHDRALVLGTPSFGKGSMQTVYLLPGGHHLKLTTAAWYTPSGRSIQRERDDAGLMEPEITGHDPAALDAAVAEPADTTAREVFHTAAGRPVYGGGGIFPDRVVRDSATAAERHLGAELQRNGLSIRQLAFRFAVRWVGEHPELEPDFEITPAMRASFLTLLHDEGVDIDESTYAEVASSIDGFLGVQLANTAFGELEALRRSHAADLTFEAAVAQLRAADSTEELLRLGTAGAP